MTVEESYQELLQYMKEMREDMATKSDLRELHAELKGDMRDLRGEMQQEFQMVRGEMQQEFQNVRTEMHCEFQNVRGEMQEGMQGLRIEMQEGLQGVRTEMNREFIDVRGNMADMESSLKYAIQIVDEKVTDVQKDVRTLFTDMNAVARSLVEIREHVGMPFWQNKKISA